MRRPLLLALSLLLGGCMVRIPVSQLEAWTHPSAQPAAPAGKPRLWLVGLALYDETWSEGDVKATASALASRATGFDVVPLLLSDSSRDRLPAPTRANVDAAVAEIARRARPDDVVLVYASTHGAPGQLARESGGQLLDPVTPAEVGEWLAPLGRQPTVLVLSACFAGSFIPALQADNRIIVTAARRDRTSFGCRAGADHTVFGQALLDALATPGISLHQAVDATRAAVVEAEHRLAIRQPSQPQVVVGAQEQALYDAPAF